MAEKEELEKPPVEKPKLKGILTMLFVGVNLLTIGGGAFWVFQSTIGYHTPQMHEEEAIGALIKERESRASGSVLFMLDPVTVNLTGVPMRKLSVEMHLEMLDSEGFEEVVTMGAQTRDAIMKLLGQKTYQDVESIQGKLFLKDQMAATVNSFLEKGVVKDIFFSNFVIE